MQDVSNDLLADPFLWLVPAQLEAAGAQGCGLKARGGCRQFWALADGQTGTGLVGTGSVLSDTLVNGLVFRGYASDGEGPGRNNRVQFVKNLQVRRTLPKLSRVPVGELDVSTRNEQFAVLQPDEMRLRNAGGCAAEDRAAPCWSGDRLRPLNKLWRSYNTNRS